MLWSSIPHSSNAADEDNESIVTLRQNQQSDRENEPNGTFPYALPDEIDNCNSNVENPITQSIDVEASYGPALATGFAFEKDLRASQTYMRALKRFSAWTASSSVAPSMGWSFFLGIVLQRCPVCQSLACPLHRKTYGAVIDISRHS